ncbi:MAG: wax ester/triacylglycerol synthase family O-acyltransferase [Candidatus Dormibacteraeota bacterium]|nr:wax ester/triacylglycerol synthase family O-acyltransferase [Candidatus Dormibacteraeota bacterium]
MPTAQRLSPLDASFLHLERRHTHMHIGGAAIFEPSPRGSGEELYEAIVRTIEPRLDLMPRYRQRVAFLPLSLDTPVWVDDPEFNIANHVLRAALPRPGGDRELKEFIGRVFSRQLDRRRPLWELYIVEGLRNGRWALLTKTHHAMVDGISNLELVTVLFDTEPDAPDDPYAESHWMPTDSPTSTDLLIRSLRDRLARPARLLNAARVMAGRPQRMAAALRETASGLTAMVENIRAPKSIINGPTGASRAYTFTRFPLDDFRHVKQALGGTINDVVLAAVAGGLRHYLVSRGEDPDDPRNALQALCPVSIRDEADRTALGNRLAMLLVKLPVDERDAGERLERVRATVDRLKARKQAVGADFLLNLAGFAPATLHAMVARASLRQIGFNLVVTNVPGPQFPLYCRGARLVEAFPIAFLYERQHVAIAIFSYMGWLNFGYLADAHGVPDVEVLAKGVEKSFKELVRAAQRAAPEEAPKQAPRPKPAAAKRAPGKGAAAKRAATTRRRTRAAAS